jgi:deoxyadenosine/deoxycytidine kinase
VEKIIVISGMIGLGKTSVSELLGKAINSEVFYESVEDNPILPLFYTMSEEELQTKRIPFLLQLHFLHTRFESIKKAYKNRNNILDRSIYEDWYFAKVNRDLGRISDLEMRTYEQLLNSMMKEIDELPYKKAPDLNVYLTASFETVMYRIGLRGRQFEQDQNLIEYYRTLWSGYDEWLHTHYKASDTLIVNMDTTDVVNRPQDAGKLIQQVKDKLKLNGGN